MNDCVYSKATVYIFMRDYVQRDCLKRYHLISDVSPWHLAFGIWCLVFGVWRLAFAI
jgi:hypothetical protein